MFNNLSACSICGKPIENHTRRTRPRTYCELCLKDRKKQAVKLFMARRRNAY